MIWTDIYAILWDGQWSISSDTSCAFVNKRRKKRTRSHNYTVLYKCVNPTLKNLGKQKKARNVFCLKSDKKEQEILLDIIDDSKMSLKNRQICKKRKQRTKKREDFGL